MMSNITSLVSSTDKIDSSLSNTKPREAVVQFQRSNPCQPVELIVNVADATVSTAYFCPMELAPHEQQAFHHASVLMLGMTCSKLQFSSRPTPEVLIYVVIFCFLVLNVCSLADISL